MKTYDIIRDRYKNPKIGKRTSKKRKNGKEKEKMKIKYKNYMIRNPLNNIIYDKLYLLIYFKI